MTETRALTVPEAARRVSRNPETIRRWVREGKVRSRKVGTQYLIEEEELDRVLEPGKGMLPLPTLWQRTHSGAPMPNVIAAVIRARAGQ